MDGTTLCKLCPHACRLKEGRAGFCHARTAKNGHAVPIGYGMLSALALDPIEKKPLRRFMPGSSILSAGGFGCNMRCCYCQNSAISQAEPAEGIFMPPEALVRHALALTGNIGVAYTYNEPGINFEYVRDCARLVRSAGLKNVMVTNGFLNEAPFLELLRYMDALNIDLKCFSEEGYRSLRGGLAPVKRNIAHAVSRAHVEITMLIVPGLSDDGAEMGRAAAWLKSLSPEIPLHITRYFPRYHATAGATPIATLEKLAGIAQSHLRHVYIGNC